MRFKCIGCAGTILLLACAGFSQECPKVKDKKAAVQFLLDNKANSTAADRQCVDEAFLKLTLATQFDNRNYIPFLVSMLDFERQVTEDESADNYRPKYPAIFRLVFLSRIRDVGPSLIKAIKQSDSEVLRTNAALTLNNSIGGCAALSLLSREDEREDVPYEQKLRIEAAAKHINDWISNQPCEANSSKP